MSENSELNEQEYQKKKITKSENSNFSEEKNKKELELFQLIHADLLSQAEQQIQALRLTINTADRLDDHQDLFFDSRIVADNTSEQLNDRTDWQGELAKLTLEEKTYFAKKLIEKENVYTALSSLDQKCNFPLLLDLVVKLYGGIKLSTGGYKLSYDLVREIEDNQWWTLLEQQLKVHNPQTLAQWDKNKSSALDTAFIQSLGHQGATGYFLDILDDDFGSEKHGRKKLSKQLKKIVKDIKSKQKKHDIYQKADQKLRSDDSICQKILDTYNLLKKDQLAIPKSLSDLHQRLMEVAKGQDAQADNQKRLRMISLLRLIGLLAPLMPDQYVKPGESENGESAFNQLFNSKFGHQVLTLVEKATFNALSDVPDDFWGRVGDNNEIFSLLAEPSLSSLKAVVEQINQDFKSEERNQLTVEDLINVYPADRVDSLVALYDKENENYESLTDIFQNAITQYQDLCAENDEAVAAVYWQKHPDYTIPSLQSIMIDEDADLSDPMDAPENIENILLYSNFWFDSWESVLYLYNSINPEDTFSTSEELKVFFADYFSFVLEQYSKTQQPSKMEDILAVALYKNNGDMSRALWDVSIFYKMLTRNNLDTGEASLEKSSGALTIKYLKDQFSYGYTAADVANILPEQQYWSMNYEEKGQYKDFDPSSINGVPYHIANCVALLEDLPAIAITGGVLMDFMTSDGYREHGSYKLEVQLNYLVDNIFPAQQFLENLPDNPEEVIHQNNSLIVPMEPYDKRLYGDDLAPEWQNLLNGKELLLPGGRTIKLTGSPAEPSLVISEQENTDLFLKTQNIEIANLDVDDLIHSAQLITNEDSDAEPFQKLDAETIARILEQHVEFTDNTNIIHMDLDQEKEVLDILQERYPDDWIIYVLNAPQLAENLGDIDFIGLVNKMEDQGILSDFFNKICTHYTDGWDKIWSAEEISAIMHEKLDLHDVVHVMGASPEFVEALYGDVSLFEYIEKEAVLFDEGHNYNYYKSFLLSGVIRNFDEQPNQLWSETEVISAILTNDHSVITDMVLSDIENSQAINKLFKQAPIESLIGSFEDDFYGNVALAKYFSENTLNSEVNLNQKEIERLILILKTELPSNWPTFVFTCPQVFAEYYKGMSFADFVNQGNGMQEVFVSYFLQFHQENSWSDNWSADEILDGLQQQFPHTWGNIVIENADVLASAISAKGISIFDISLNTSYSSSDFFYFLMNHYDSCWDQQLSVDDLLWLMDWYDPDHKAANVMRYRDVFQVFFKDYTFSEFIEKIGSSKENVEEIIDHYAWDSDWRLWSREEVEKVIQESYPDLYEEFLSALQYYAYEEEPEEEKTND